MGVEFDKNSAIDLSGSATNTHTIGNVTPTHTYWPYQYPDYRNWIINYPPIETAHWDIQIRSVKNGFVVKDGTDEVVFEAVERLNAYILKKFKGKIKDG